jgi:predicted MPP superfamily phosphohydrolase
MLTRRQFIFGVAGGLVTAGPAVYSLGVEPRWLEVTHTTIPLGRARPLATPIRVVQLSDFHLSPIVSLDYIAESVALALAQKPDLIALTGDYYTRGPRELAAYTKVLAPLAAAAPTFACLGNHDGGAYTKFWGGGGQHAIDQTIGFLKAAGIPCLVNEARTVMLHGQPIQIIGTGDYWTGMCAPTVAFHATPPRGDALRIVLNHNPDAKMGFRPFDWDVMLCGHTHGGQVRLPFIGTPIVPVEDRRYIAGLYRWEDRWLYITRGVGNLHGIRFRCRPEVSVLTLT